MLNKDDIIFHINKTVTSDENEVAAFLLKNLHLNEQQTSTIHNKAVSYIEYLRNHKSSGIESFIAEYGLSNEEGIAVMCLAEALLRIPDNNTALELIEDKLRHKKWSEHLGKSHSFLVNASSWGLALTGKLVDMSESNFSVARFINRLSEPVILKALKQAIKFISNEFIMGSSMNKALHRAKSFGHKGYRISFDILGEASRTQEQADFYFEQYIKAIPEIAKLRDPNTNLYSQPNISVKLTALHPRFELIKQERVIAELLPKLIKITKLCIQHNVTVSFDAEEAFRLNIYLKVIENLLAYEEFRNFHGIGVVIQAYQKRAFYVIDYIAMLAKNLNKRIPIRLVKGAYWDTEIKRAQELGLEGYPVFTRKEFTDLSYLACTEKIIKNSDFIYPQFATHNAYTTAAIEVMAQGIEFEFQKLHGMGNTLHEKLLEGGYQSRIYAPIGKYEDLLAYLMRRMLENGANTSFVNLINDKSITPQELASDPLKVCKQTLTKTSDTPLPKNIFGKIRTNSIGYDLGFERDKNLLESEIQKFQDKQYSVASIINGKKDFHTISAHQDVYKPANNSDVIGSIYKATQEQILNALNSAKKSFYKWSYRTIEERAAILETIADLYFEYRHEFYSILIKEGGKNIHDAIAEVREAIDFAKYYAYQAREIIGKRINLPGYVGESNELSLHGRGVFVCISPWNFPLAIFSGQIFAALVTGNSVLAKPAENTSIVAHLAIKLMHKAGIPKEVLHLLIARGKDISNILLTHNDIGGICFTGSSEVARSINQILAAREDSAIVPLIAETGGQNAMIIDSSALLEQVTDHIIASSFGSAGQRCSALRVAYIQEDIYEPLLKLLIRAMDELKFGDPEDSANDIGPVISHSAKESLQAHIEYMKQQGFEILAVHKDANSPNHEQGSFFVSHIIRINHISDLKQENFGPILHIKPFKHTELDQIIEEINSTGYGLTFGIQSRIEEKINYIASKARAGNVYANRTIIGAQVGTQPFGGEGRSGTGFKAGGPFYLLKFTTEKVITVNTTAIGGNVELLG